VEARTRLSPAVRALVEEHRISDAELSRIEGSGIGGRISKKDVEDYVAKRTQPAAANGEKREMATTAAPTPGTTIPLSPMRRAIANNMLKSKQTIPHAWTVAEVDMTSVVRFRQKIKESFKQREGIDLTYVPIIVKAVVEGLKAVSVLNASWTDQGVLLHKDINVGVAVSVDDGLIVPVIHQADRMSIAGLAKVIDDLAKRARAGKLGIPDVQGATFTVNNPGTFGTILSYSIIAPPQAGILAMDAIVKRPVVVEGDAIAIRSMMNLCLSFDHRVLDGVSAARFLQGVRRWLEGFSEQVPLY
jgi:pyruvate/2-oxoglutarate dehydrogenase complex dihydrolipoamide acyltransferase (E2) component